jgi:hypothetical protein
MTPSFEQFKSNNNNLETVSEIETTPAFQEVSEQLQTTLDALMDAKNISEPRWNFFKKCMPIACALALSSCAYDADAQQSMSTYSYPVYGNQNGGYVQNQQVNPQVIYGTVDNAFRMAGQVSQNVEQTSTDPKTKKEAQVSKQIFIFLDNLTQKAAQIDYTFRRP